MLIALLAGPYREFLGITGSATPARTGPNGERT